MAQGDVRINLEAQGLEVLHNLPVGLRYCLALSPSQAIDDNIQRALSCNPRVKLPYGASSGIPRVGKK